MYPTNLSLLETIQTDQPLHRYDMGRVDRFHGHWHYMLALYQGNPSGKVRLPTDLTDSHH